MTADYQTHRKGSVPLTPIPLAGDWRTDIT
jgi:hypothetical protein